MKIVGIAFIILALVIGIVPMFTDCQSQGRAIELPAGKTIPMKCHWTGTSELVIGGSLLVLGVLLLRSKRRETMRSLAVLGIVLGTFSILLPTVLIGVCASDEMLCNVLMKPTLILTGILTIIASIAAFVLAGRQPEEPAASAGLPA
jgi:hypothetical protein